MSSSPTSLLQRLQQLKVWQKDHESRLKLGESSTLSDYQTIDGLSDFDSPNKSKTITQSPSKPFQQLLEENLDQNSALYDEKCVDKPKRPYLKKGAGLVRYNLKPQKPLKIRKKKTVTITGMTPLKAPDFVVQTKATWTTIPESVQETNATPPMSEGSEQTQYEKALEKELLIFEELEKKASNSSFSSTNSSVLRILSSTPSKTNEENVPNDPKRVHWEGSDSSVNATRPNLHQLLLRLQNITENHRNLPSNYSSTESLSTTISSSDLGTTLKEDAADNTDSDCLECENELKSKIDEYDEKIDILNREKSNLDQLKDEFDRKRHEFEEEMLEKRREFDEERRILLYELKEEKERLINEKTSYQTCVKNAGNKPSKKEREELTSLRQELADFKEISKMKETKNGMTQARLRNQVKQLEKDNFELREQVEKLTKDNAKLSARCKMSLRKSDGKILQEINKNVTKLTEDALKTTKKAEHHPKTTEIEPKPSSGIIDNKNTGKIEIVLEDGSKEIKYPNGNIKSISSDGNLIIMRYFNGDVKKTNLIDGTIDYYYRKNDSSQTTLKDGTEIVEFNDGSKETRHVDGRCEIVFPDGIKQTINVDGSQAVTYPDGSYLIISKTGEKTLQLPNGQKEIQSNEHMRREYPDGTVKILYPDGTQETRYSNGRIRVKDCNGKLLIDREMT